jgi:hypothetical protein
VDGLFDGGESVSRRGVWERGFGSHVRLVWW